MNTKIKYIIGLALSFTFIPAYSAVYYVSTSSGAKDSNSGTEGNPWATTAKAAQTAVAGDTVIFEDGFYNITSSNVRFANKGSSGSPIIFKSRNKHGAHIHKDVNLTGDTMLSIGIYSSGWVEDQDMYLVFDGFELSGSKRHAIQSAGGGQLTIKNCLIHDTGNDAIKINSHANNILIENNEIYNTGIAESNCNVTHACNSDGIDITSSDNVTVRGNHLHDIASWGLYTKKGSHNSIIENNLIHDVLEGGIGLGESTVTYNAIARNNILYNINMSCLQFAGAKDSKFHNNTCYNVSTFQGGNWAGLRVAPAQHTDGADSGDDKYSRNVEFYNNIVVINNDQGVCFKASDPSFNGGNKTANIAQLKMNNNICYNLTSGVDYKWIFEGREVVGFSNWKAYTNSLGNELSTDSIVDQDPMFLNTSNSSMSNFYMIDVGSPLKDAGFDVSADVTNDYFGNSRQGLAIDIGAVENTLNMMPTPANFSIIKS